MTSIWFFIIWELIIILIGACLGSFIEVVLIRTGLTPIQTQGQQRKNNAVIKKNSLFNKKMDRKKTSSSTQKSIIFASLKKNNSKSIKNGELSHQSSQNSWIWGRSHCDVCRQPIAWYDNLPLLSYPLLRGRCRGCGCQIARRTWYMELIFALIVGIWGWFWGRAWLIGALPVFGLDTLWSSSPISVLPPLAPTSIIISNFLGSLVILVILILFGVIAVIDARIQIIPDKLLLVILALVLLLVLGKNTDFLTLPEFSFGLTMDNFGLRLLATLIIGLIFYLVHWLALKIYGQDAFGLGDVKFLMLATLMVGLAGVLILSVLAFGLGAIFGLIQILLRQAHARSHIPLGPFLVIGIFFILIINSFYPTLLTNFLNISLISFYSMELFL